MTYEHLEALIALKVDKGECSNSWNITKTAWAKANHQITSHWYWPFFLPSDAEQMAKTIVDQLEKQMDPVPKEEKDAERGESDY